MYERSSKKEQDPNKHTIVVNQVQKKSNGIGTAGFVIALIALFVGWVPLFGWLMWILGLVFSFIGVFKPPRGMAIAGLIISFLGIILLVLIFAGISALALSA